MARLIEPAAESVESLKRRFIRQNRELARNNSNQSVKIRALEDEISRLLVGNISLREENIQLRNELDATRDQAETRDLAVVKFELENKLKEMLDITSSLGRTKRKPKRRKSQMPSPRKAPSHNRSLSEELLDQEGRMPTIVEGKYYPRKTMDTSDIQSLLQETLSDSPAISLPPMDSLNSPNTRQLKQQRQQEDEARSNTEPTAELLFANFENRRRRRESQVQIHEVEHVEDSVMIIDHKQRTTEPEPEDKPTIRTGAKRKLDVRNDSRPKVNINGGLLSTHEDGRTRENNSSSSPRKILGPKPVNTDPIVSPRKNTSTKKASFKSDQDEKLSHKKTSVPRQPRIGKAVEIAVPTDTVSTDATSTVEIVPDNLVKLEPKTPCELSIFSPPSTLQKIERPELRDTPPPADIKLDVNGLGDGNGSLRGSRRSRTAVSYAEPSLNTKMRRPSKALVDAVVKKASDERVTVDVDAERPTSREGPIVSKPDSSSVRTVIIKKEDADTKDWQPSNSTNAQEKHRSEPQSPLESKIELSGALISDIISSHPEPVSLPRATARSRRRSTLQPLALELSEHCSTEAIPSSVGFGAQSIFDVPATPDTSSAPESKSNTSSASSSTISETDKSKLPSRSLSSGSSSRATGASKSTRRQTLGASLSASDLGSSSSSATAASSSSRITSSKESRLNRSTSSAALNSTSSRPQSRDGDHTLGCESEGTGSNGTRRGVGNTTLGRRKSTML